jgi:hypothetical protein
MKQVLQQIKEDGKDPELFLDKIHCQSNPYPLISPEDVGGWVDKDSDEEPEEVSLDLPSDRDYGSYYNSMKRCHSCEQEILKLLREDQEKARIGYARCAECGDYEKHHYFPQCDQCRSLENICDYCANMTTLEVCRGYEMKLCKECSD